MVSRRPITPAPKGVIYNPRIRPTTAQPRTEAQNPTAAPPIPGVIKRQRSQSTSGTPQRQEPPVVPPSTPRTVPRLPTGPPQEQQVSTPKNKAPTDNLLPSPPTPAERRSTSSRIPIIPLSGVTYRPPRRKPVPPPQVATPTPPRPARIATMSSPDNDDAVRNILRSNHLDTPNIHSINKDPSIDFKPNRRSWHPLDSDSPVIRDFGLRHSMQDLTNTREPVDDADAIITQEDFDELPGTDHSVGSRHPDRFLANRVDVIATGPDGGEGRVTAVSFQEAASVNSAGSSGRRRPASPVSGNGRPKTALERVFGLGNGGTIKKTGGKKEIFKEFFKGVFKRN